jgi:primosomal protein N' (replication factor Y)
LDKAFDYLVPDHWSEPVEVGTRVRISLQGRRVGGWVVAVDVEPPPGVALRPLAKHSGRGPSADVVDLARWVAHRWHGRWSAVLATASPQRVVTPSGPAVGPEDRRLPAPLDDRAVEAVGAPGVTVVRLAPTADPFPYALAAARLGDALVVVPSLSGAHRLAGTLGRAGGRAALLPRDWAMAAQGGSAVFGARSAALGPVDRLGAVVVVDEHDEALQEERNPTWHARDVAVERARRAGVPCVLVSAAPSLAALAIADRVLVPARAEERAGWPIVDVVDRRREEPGRAGLLSSRLADAARRAERVVCVLNRKGRSRLLACASCGELVRTEDGAHLMVETGGALVSPVTGERRPLVCAVCSGAALRRLRLGVDRVRDELEALLREPVCEITGDAVVGDPGARVVVGTEAVLHRAGRADLVAFLDFDQELLAPRYRAAEQAMALLVRAARLAGPRSGGGRVLVQTRTPSHRVLDAAVRADPGRLAAAEEVVRRALGFPPHGALAELSGPGAAELADRLAGGSGLTVLGPRHGRFLVRAPDPAHLADALAATSRPPARVRVAVDPPRA